jgi:hypothetical protein
MDVSIGWVVVGSIAGVWTGFTLFALMAMAREPDGERSPEPRAGTLPPARGRWSDATSSSFGDDSGWRTDG